MACDRRCEERKGVRVVLWCGREDRHPEHDHHSRKSGRTVHCYGV